MASERVNVLGVGISVLNLRTALAAIAHPDFRPELEAQAASLGRPG